MNLEKYDLVLMVRAIVGSFFCHDIYMLFEWQDIVMPKLDGVTATSLIRQFDHMTPIISMTSNSKPNEIMTYYSSGEHRYSSPTGNLLTNAILRYERYLA